MSFLGRSSCDLGCRSSWGLSRVRVSLASSLEKPRVRGARNRGRRATIRLSLSRATNKTTTSMRAPGLSLLAAVISVSFSDALSTLNGRVDEDHNAIVVEGGSTHASLLPIHDIEVSLCSRTCVSDKPQIGLLLSDLAAKIGSPIGESTWQSRIWKRIVFWKKAIFFGWSETLFLSPWIWPAPHAGILAGGGHWQPTTGTKLTNCLNVSTSPFGATVKNKIRFKEAKIIVGLQSKEFWLTETNSIKQCWSESRPEKIGLSDNESWTSTR